MPNPTQEETLAEQEAHVEGIDGTGKDMSRIIGISDAVFAFSMTFLVITLVVPQFGSVNRGSLWAYLHDLEPGLVAYLISFFVITAWWGTHRRMFSPIVRYDPLLVRLNNFFLLVIAITPFPVAILYDYGPSVLSFGPGNLSTQLAVALFASVQVVGGLIMLAIWRHSTTHHRLVEERLPAIWIRRTEQGSIYSTAVFGASVPVAFVSPLLAMLLWFAMIVGLSRIRRKHRANPSRRPSVSAESKAPPLT